MDAERIRSFLLQLPHVTETLQWGENLVFWIGDRTIGGKIFAILNLGAHGQIASYAAGPERFSELVEREGIVPAPYLARVFWVGIEHWDVFRSTDWEDEIRAAHAIVFNKLPKKTRTLLELPATERKRAAPANKRSAKGDSATPAQSTSNTKKKSAKKARKPSPKPQAATQPKTAKAQPKKKISRRP